MECDTGIIDKKNNAGDDGDVDGDCGHCYLKVSE